MKTILVDGISGLILKDGTLQQEMYELLEQYPNPKLVLTGANDVQWKQFNLDVSPYDVFTLSIILKKLILNISKYYSTNIISLQKMSYILSVVKKLRLQLHL